MTQTLFALLALALGSTLVMQQSTQAARSERMADGHEVAASAADAAAARLAFVSTLAFDQATVAGRATALGQLTPAIAPYVAGGADTPGDDIDDFHRTTATVARAVDSGTVSFSLLTTVQYVSEADGDTASLVPTRFKKVTVTATAANVPGQAAVTLSQLYQCGTRCVF